MPGYENDDDNDSKESQRQKSCVDCGTLSPPTDESFTMISSRFGWRLTRGVSSSGEPIVEWRCPSCWARLKGRADPSKKRA
jgi:hypothetical protein